MGERKYQRVKMVLPIRIAGQDAKGKSFTQLAHTLDFSRMGARLGGVRAELRVDDELTVEYKRNRGRFKVRWVSAARPEVGVQSLEPEKFVFLELPEEKYSDDTDSTRVRDKKTAPAPARPAPPATPVSPPQGQPAEVVKTAPAEPAKIPAPAEPAKIAPAAEREEVKRAPAEAVTIPLAAEPAKIPLAASAVKNPPAVIETINDSGPLAELKRKLRETKDDTDGALQLVANSTREVLSATGAAVAVTAGDDWICRASAGVAPRVGVRFQSPHGLTGQAASSGQVVICHNTEEDRRVNPAIWRSVQLRSAASVPIMSKGSILGVLEVFADHPDAFSDEQAPLLREVAELVADLITASTTSSK